MALRPKIFKVNIQIADMDRHHYMDHLITIAQHPSETDERLMVSILAFALNASDNLTFASGISDPNQADLWDKDHNEHIGLWISVGLPDEKLIRKAVSRAEQVIVYTYGGRTVDVWWNKLQLKDYQNLRVINLTGQDTRELSTMLARGMKINFTIQEGEIMVSNEAVSINITQQVLK